VIPERGTLSPGLTRLVLDLDFQGEDHARYEELSAKAEEETLTPDEESELDGFFRVDSLLAILRLKSSGL
jgi:hypothetical protein